ncbi:MAG: hypothetical protein KAH10_06880 [Flavobacteriales bacterium]|nr:hypothetical protein [Flavobacteriales bacterium]
MLLSRKYFILILILFVSLNSFSQTNDKELRAHQLLEEGEYDSAINIYKELLANNINYHPYYNNLLESYIRVQRIDSADSLVDFMINNKPYNPTYLVDKGYIQSKKNNRLNAEKYYQKAVDLVLEKPNTSYSTSIKFQKYQELEWALKTYTSAERINPNLNFAIQKANIYGELGMIDSMLSNYFVLVEKQPARKGTVKIYLQNFLKQNPSPEISEKVKNILLLKIQETNEAAFSELLLWYFTENKKYSSAFIQAKSLYKRNYAPLDLIQNLGEYALKDKQIENAEKCFVYIRDEAPESLTYFVATKSLLEMQSIKLRDKLSESETLAEYNIAINKKNLSFEHFELILSYAKYVAFNLHKLDEALLILKKETEAYSSYDNIMASRFLLEGDIYLLKEEFTKSFLSYQKAETWSEDRYLSDEAKYKSVKVAFYKGDFKWALGQSKVLKKSISKWYANDSAELLITLQNSYSSDSSEVAIKLYAKADLLNMQGKPDSSYVYYEQIIKSFPAHYLVPAALYSQSKILKESMAYNRCIETLQDLYSKYPDNNLAPFALMSISEVYLQKLKNNTEAKIWIEELLKNFPDSPIANDARDIYERINIDEI